MVVDEETAFFSQLQWARILVKVSEKKWLGSLQVEAGNSSWKLSLWWEASPRVMQVESSSWLQMRKGCEVRDEGGGVSRAEARVREPQFEFQNRGSDVQVACGSGLRTADDVRGRPTVTPVAGSLASGLGPKFGCWVSSKGASGPVLKGATGWAEGLSSLGPAAHPSPFGEPVPSRAPFEFVGNNAGLEQELLAVGDTGGKVSSLGRLRLTDEALLDEASRYPLHLKLPILSLGLRVSSPSTPFLGPDVAVMGNEGVSSGMFGAAEGARSRAPLREERLEVFSAREGWNLSPQAAGGDAKGLS